MTRLLDALRRLGLSGRVEPSGRWLTLDGERCRVYVAESRRGGGYYTWCDDPADRVVEHYPDPGAAIRAGLRRAAQRPAAAEGRKSDDGTAAPVPRDPSRAPETGGGRQEPDADD
jgi:hypothetical protein